MKKIENYKELLKLLIKAYGVKNEKTSKGIRHVLKSRLLQIPEGTDKLSLIVDLSEEKIKALFEKLIKDIITTEIA